MPPIRLIAVDIDGTLLTSSFNIAPADKQALEEAHHNGVIVVLATGRRHAFARPIATQLGFDPFIISSNGALTRDAEGALIDRTLMPAAVAKQVLDTMAPWNDHAVMTMDREGPGAMLVQSRAALSARIARWVESNSQVIAEVSPLQEALTEDPLQLMYCGTLSDMRQARALFESSALPQHVSCHNTQYDHRDLSILDLLPLGCTKGHALARLCDSLGISASEVLAVGDNYNDTEMLDFAGHAYVMANCHDDMKSRGWNLTLSNDECGVAHAIQTVLSPVSAR